MNKFKNMDDQIVTVFKLFAVLCGVLFINLVYIQIYQAPELMKNPYNSQVMAKGDEIQRGNILASDGTILAYSKQEKSGNQRIYPFDKMYSPLLGYYSERYGNAGVEATENMFLAGDNLSRHFLGPVAQLFEDKEGYNVRLTINSVYQEAADRALGSNQGAVVILDRETGEVLALVSKPCFNPNTVDKEWDSLINDSRAPLLNRVTQGLYPPGSTIKPLIAVGGLETGAITPTTLLNGNSNWKLGPQYTLSNDDNANYGDINLDKAMTVSSNTYFGRVALAMGAGKLASTFDKFGLQTPLNTDMVTNLPNIPDFSKLSQGELAQVGIGQTSLLFTPLRLAMIAAAIGNDGTMMKPYVIKDIENADGKIKKSFSGEVFTQVAAKGVTAAVAQAMEDVVLEGTGTRAAIPGIKIIGKTGTAENSTGRDHAWFMGCADLPSRKIAFAVIVEQGGFGGATAAPIIRNTITNILAKEGK